MSSPTVKSVRFQTNDVFELKGMLFRIEHISPTSGQITFQKVSAAEEIYLRSNRRPFSEGRILESLS